MQVELDKAIDLNYNTECAAITYANVLLTWAVSNPVYVVYSIYGSVNIGRISVEGAKWYPTYDRISQCHVEMPQSWADRE